MLSLALLHSFQKWAKNTKLYIFLPKITWKFQKIALKAPKDWSIRLTTRHFYNMFPKKLPFVLQSKCAYFFYCEFLRTYARTESHVTSLVWRTKNFQALFSRVCKVHGTPVLFPSPKFDPHTDNGNIVHPYILQEILRTRKMLNFKNLRILKP